MEGALLKHVNLEPQTLPPKVTKGITPAPKPELTSTPREPRAPPESRPSPHLAIEDILPLHVQPVEQHIARRYIPVDQPNSVHVHQSVAHLQANLEPVHRVQRGTLGA